MMNESERKAFDAMRVALIKISGMQKEENEWDAVDKFIEARAIAYGALADAIPQGDGCLIPTLKEGDVEWVVNDIAELGVKIGNQFFFLYKGNSLQYDGFHDENDDGVRLPMKWRHVYKREFGECCHPVEALKASGRMTLDDFISAYGWPEDWQNMPALQPTDRD